MYAHLLFPASTQRLKLLSLQSTCISLIPKACELKVCEEESPCNVGIHAQCYEQTFFIRSWSKWHRQDVQCKIISNFRHYVVQVNMLTSVQNVMIISLPTAPGIGCYPMRHIGLQQLFIDGLYTPVLLGPK